jgi:hypothetical protein
MNNELEFFGTSQKDAFLSMANNLIKCYNSLSTLKLPLYGHINEIYRQESYKYKECTAFNAMIRKLNNIIFANGDPLSATVLLKDIANNKIKHLGKGGMEADSTLEETYLGKGHFRWDWIAHTLNETELKAVKLYVSGNNTDFATTEFKFKNLLISAKLIKSGVPFPNSKDTGLHNMFDISVTNTDTDNKTSFNFYGSQHDYNNAVTEIKGEDLLNAFECFISDSLAGYESFEDFCGNMGYDEDSRTAERIYKECVKSMEKAKSVIDADLYDFANELQERLN